MNVSTKNESSKKLLQGLIFSFVILFLVSNIASAKIIWISWFHLLFPAGLILYPLTFLISDLVNEIFGKKAAKKMLYIAIGISFVIFLVMGLGITAAGFKKAGDVSFLKMSFLRFFSSILAFCVAHLTDVYVYHWIKSQTRRNKLWLRINGSTIFSQLIDTIVIDILFLYLGLGMSLPLVINTMFFSFMYKCMCSILITPIFYALVHLLEKILLKQCHNQRKKICLKTASYPQKNVSHVEAGFPLLKVRR